MAKHKAQRIRVYPLTRKPGKRVSEKVARPTRGGIQWAIAGAIAVQLNPHLPHMVDNQRLVLTGVLAALVNAAWVAVEDRLQVGFMRAVPPTTVPAVDGA